MKTILAEDSHVEKNMMGDCLFQEVVQRDCYAVRDFYRRRGDIVKVVIDVGANVGFFSIMSAVLFPTAYKVAIEPGDCAYIMLAENMAGLNVRCEKAAIGNGEMAMQKEDITWKICSSDRYEISKDGTIKTMRLSEILTSLKVPQDNMLLKLDCEGAEKWLIDDAGLEPWLKHCVYFVAEFHETSSNPKDSWDDWIAKMFMRYATNKQFTWNGTQHNRADLNTHSYILEKL
jgi:FkbM family methyltransferase